MIPSLVKPISPMISTEKEGMKEPIRRLFSSENHDNTPDFIAELREN